MSLLRDGSIGEQLFNELKSDVVTSYSAIICGMCKYGQVNRAYEVIIYLFYLNCNCLNLSTLKLLYS